ncbi:protein turtle [Lingula anatina]|uniref:Protein turtle n=1 Tax=Lingula anatina TaxID=7574 RepID=A0A1S3IAS1_LINAN|nr:protein turtle [Lingula anatina]|eukprot:XP_013395357.1 protein turtle [Lingula anatina]
MVGFKLVWVVYLAQVLATCQVCFALVMTNNCTDTEDNVIPCNISAPYACIYETGSVKKIVNEGSNEILECNINYPGGKFVDNMIEWKKEGLEQAIFAQFEGFTPHVDAQYAGRISLVEQASIEISSIRQSDAGWYMCKVIFLDSDKEENRTKIYLQVNYPPRITNSSTPTLIHKRGDSASLFCEASGMPTPTVSWTKNGEPLMDSVGRKTVDGNRIEIVDLHHEDGGVYVCTFTNSISQVSQSIKLVVEVFPD